MRSRRLVSFPPRLGHNNYIREEVTSDAPYPYKVNGQLVDYEFKLKHGSSEKKFQIDKISNSEFTDVSLDWLVHAVQIIICCAERV